MITKKKHYIGIPVDDAKDPVIKGMEGMKSDRPRWINKITEQFAYDIKYSKDPCGNIRNELRSLESGLIPLEDLEIKLTLTKNPTEYPKNRLQRAVGLELNAAEGDTIKFYKSNNTGGGTPNPNLISRGKYIEILKTTIEESLKALGYDFSCDILGQKKIGI